MNTTCTAVVNAQIIFDNTILKGQTLFFDHQILGILPDSQWPCRPGVTAATPSGTKKVTECHDAGQSFLSPGFIDVHIHGCAGKDTMDDSPSALAQIQHTLPRTGVTAFLPTTMTMEFSLVMAALKRIQSAMSSGSGASILGCHLEGPFINESYKGAQNADFVLPPDFNRVADFRDVIKLITIAPETTGSIDFIRQCTAAGLIASIGHSGATYEETQRALTAGATHFTHTFNAATPFNHRNPGVVGAALDSAASCELIADNIHVHPAAQRILLKAKGPERIILVTDAMRACLMGDGDFDLGGQTVTVQNGQARLASGVIAGSVLTLNRAVQNFQLNTGISLPMAIRLVTANPAALLGLSHRKGTLSLGSDADLTIFDQQFNVAKTFVGGQLVHSTPEVSP